MPPQKRMCRRHFQGLREALPLLFQLRPPSHFHQTTAILVAVWASLKLVRMRQAWQKRDAWGGA